jgi:hypothetical protein
MPEGSVALGRGERSKNLVTIRIITMNTNQILTALGVVVAIAAVFVGQVAALSALVLVAL